MKLGTALGLLQAIRQIQHHLDTAGAAPSPLFSFGLSTNARLLQPHAESYMASLNQGLDLGILEMRRVQRQTLLTEAALKDLEGRPLMVEQQFILRDPLSQIPAIDQQLATLFPEADVVEQAQAARRAELDPHEVDITLHKIPLGLWPALPTRLVDVAHDLIQPE